MADLLINYWEGIGDDQYTQNGYEVFDAHNIDYSSGRKITAIGTYTGQDGTELITGASSTSLFNVTEVNAVTALSFSSGEAKVYYSGTLNGIGYTSQNHITVGTDLSAYNETTNPKAMRHFFMPYNAGRIVYSNYNASSVSTIDVSAVARLNITGAYPGAMEYVWKGSLLFGYGNGIFSLNPSTTTPSYTKEEITLPEGAFVNFLRYYGGQLWIIYTKEGINSTFIQGASYSGTAYTLNTYHVEVSGQKCIGACSDSGVIYWVSETSINVFDGSQNHIVKTLYEKDGATEYFYNPNSRQSRGVISYHDGFIRVNGVGKYYLYGTKKPNTKKNMTEVSLTTGEQIACFSDGGKAVVYHTGSTKMYNCDTGYAMYNSYIVTNPFTGGRLSQQKKSLGIRIGYNMKQTNPGTIKVSIITDDIIRSNSGEFYSDYVDLVTINDSSNTFYEIMPTNISSALGTAGYSDEFGLVKIRIDLYGAGVVGGLTETRYTNHPDLFDIYFTYEEIGK